MSKTVNFILHFPKDYSLTLSNNDPKIGKIKIHGDL
jgi:hypothetical protein